MSHRDFLLEIAHNLCAGTLLTSGMVGWSPSQSLSHLQGKHFLYHAKKKQDVLCVHVKRFRHGLRKGKIQK